MTGVRFFGCEGSITPLETPFEPWSDLLKPEMLKLLPLEDI